MSSRLISEVSRNVILDMNEMPETRSQMAVCTNTDDRNVTSDGWSCYFTSAIVEGFKHTGILRYDMIVVLIWLGLEALYSPLRHYTVPLCNQPLPQPMGKLFTTN